MPMVPAHGDRSDEHQMKLQGLGSAALAGMLALGAASAARADVEEALAALRAGDAEAARTLLEVEAEGGDALAQYHLGTLLVSAVGPMRDVPAGLTWLEQAVEQDHGPALLLFGRLHEMGLGVPQDFEVARQSYAAAAEAGLPAAEELLAWDECWSAPTASCLLRIAEAQLGSEGFRDPIPGRVPLTMVGSNLALDDADRALELLSAVQDLPLSFEQTERLAEALAETAVVLGDADRLDEARSVLDAFGDPSARIIPYARLAATVANRDADAAQALIGDATDAAGTLPNDIGRADALAQAGAALTAGGAPDLARDMLTAAADTLPDPTVLTLSTVNRVRAALAGGFAQIGDAETAATLADAVDGSVPAVWRSVVAGLIDAGAADAARDLIADIPRDAVRINAALDVLAAADADAAPALIDRLRSDLAGLTPSQQHDRLTARAVAVLAAQGQVEFAIESVGRIDGALTRVQAVEAAQAVLTDDTDGQRDLALGLALAVIGLEPTTLDAPTDAAQPIATALLAGAEAPLFADEGPLRDEALRLAARGLARIGATEAAAGAVDGIASEERRFYGRLAVIEAAGRSGDDAIGPFLDAALSYAAPGAARFRPRALGHLATTLADTGDLQGAVATARRIDDASVLTRTLLDLVARLAAVTG